MFQDLSIEKKRHLERFGRKLGHGSQNGWLSAIIFFNMRNIWKIGPDSWTITIEQKVQFWVGIYHETIQLVQIQNGRFSK